MKTSKESKLAEYNLYLDAIAAGSHRSRTVITAMGIGAILAALALINSFKPDWNWHFSRLKTANHHLRWLEFDGESDSTKLGSLQINGLTKPNLFTAQEFRTLVPDSDTVLHACLDTMKKYLPHLRIRIPASNIVEGKYTFPTKGSIPELIAAIGFAKQKNFVDRRELEQYRDWLHKSIIDHRLMINIPIIGLSIDINNLCWASGLAFTFFYSILIFGLTRERKNIVLAFHAGNRAKIEISEIYQLLSMRQVLTVPKSMDEYLDKTRKTAKKSVSEEEPAGKTDINGENQSTPKEGAPRSHDSTPDENSLEVDRISEALTPKYGQFFHNKVKTLMGSGFPRLFPIVALAAPTVVIWLIFGYDLITADIGRAINEGLYNFECWVSLVVCTLTSLIAGIALISMSMINHTWDHYHRYLVEAYQKENPNPDSTKPESKGKRGKRRFW